MSERERLIELLQEWGNKENDGVRAESIADYLLERDAIAQPVKVGDTVYTVSKRDGIVAKIVVEISWKRDCAGTENGQTTDTMFPTLVKQYSSQKKKQNKQYKH